jgi:hypothetical protein
MHSCTHRYMHTLSLSVFSLGTKWARSKSKISEIIFEFLILCAYYIFTSTWCNNVTYFTAIQWLNRQV